MTTPYPSTRMMPQTVAFQRRTETTDVNGNTTWTWANNLTSIRASVQPAVSTEALMAGAERNTESVDIYVDGGQDIRNDDRMVYTDQWGVSRTYGIVRPQNLAGRGVVDHIVGVMSDGVEAD